MRERESRFGGSSFSVFFSGCSSYFAVQAMVVKAVVKVGVVAVDVGVYMRGPGDDGEVGAKTSPNLLALGVIKAETGMLETKETTLDPEPRAEETGSLKLNPNPLASCLSSFPNISAMSSLPTSHSSGLDSLTALFTPLVRLLEAETGVHNPPVPLPISNPDPGDAETSLLAEQTKTGTGI